MTITVEPKRPNCICGNPAKITGKTKLGFNKHSKFCSPCQKRKYCDITHREGYRYSVYKKDYCETCGFVAQHKCQLDVDHVDGDHSNNSPDNLKTLCANCHRLKTFNNKDWKKNKAPN